jgi:tetratricopeptide (TPR) repeat protein
MNSTINRMYKIREEPDQQHFMGELYYQINQLPQAIDCFLWDLELNPINPRPIKWLTKLYNELGMVEESKSYQYLYKQVQKSS